MPYSLRDNAGNRFLCNMGALRDPNSVNGPGRFGLNKEIRHRGVRPSGKVSKFK